MEKELTFQDLGLPEALLAALDQKGYGYPTRVQAEAIPPLMAWKDVIAKAPTGTGKTFAFGIPMICHIDAESEALQGLILAPTRELAIQIGDELRGLLAYYKNIRVAVVYGGQKIDAQIRQLKKKPQIVVATPGRLMDHMKRRTVRLGKVDTVVLDEADRMLDMGFIKDVTRILKQIPHKKNMGMFSATISREVLDISWLYQRDPVEIVVRPVEEDRPQITQYRLKVDMGGKVDLLCAILEKEALDRVLVFCNTKNTTDRVVGLLNMRQVPAECIHGDLSQKVREKVLGRFRRRHQLRHPRGGGVLRPPHRPDGPGQAHRPGLQPDLLGHRRHPPGRDRRPQPLRHRDHDPVRPVRGVYDRLSPHCTV